MIAYLLGVATLPALAGTSYVLAWMYFRVTGWLESSFGISFEAKVRKLDGISDYTLRHDVWWERSFGPVFTGGWYRENPVYDAPDHAYATRWIGFGNSNGACVQVFRVHDLGLIADAP